MKSTLYEELKRYGESDFYPFHMPGHKRNPQCGLPIEMVRLDITEIDGFDNLHQAEGIIKEAQNRAAALYRSKETFFLVNGSTSGLLTAISAVAGRGKKLILARNCHKAVYHGIILNHLEPEYIYPEIINEFGISDGIKSCQIEKKIKEIAVENGSSHKNVNDLIAGIVITSPTYDGILSDVAGIVRVAHSYGIPVIVDQAHGAHFGFHPSFPESAVLQGADLVIHSVHKTLPSFTQTALLHCNSTMVNSEIVKKYLRIYQSSSPSYLLMAGIDTCMEIVEKEGRERLEELLCHRRKLIEENREGKHIKIYPSMAEKDGKNISSTYESGIQEPGRLLISVRESNMTGQKLYDVLREDYHLQMEMCASDYVIAILSMMDKREGFERLSKALQEIDKEIGGKTEDKEKNYFSYQQYEPEMVVNISDAFTREGSYLPLEKAEECIAADFINFYPPDIPVLVPGEKVDNKVIQMIENYVKEGYMVQGVEKDKEDGRYKIKVIF